MRNGFINWTARLLFYFLIVFSCFILPADAGPIFAAVGAIAGAIGSAVAAGGLLSAFVKLALGVALQAGISLVRQALAGTPEQKTAGIRTQVQIGGTNPLSFLVGDWASPGQLEYINSTGTAKQDHVTAQNAFLTLVISLSDLPVIEISPSFFVNGELVTANLNDFDPADGRGYRVPAFDNDGSPRMWINFYDGTQTAADPFLLEYFGPGATKVSNPNVPWTADMIGRGIAFVIVTIRLDRETFSGIPKFQFQGKGIRQYDLRKDSTNGGSGAVRWDDQSTWTTDGYNNPAVIRYNIARGIYYNGEWIYGGQNLPAALLPSASWIAAANVDDIPVYDPRIGQNRKQFRAGGEIDVDVEPLSVIGELNKSSNGHFAEIGGYYKIKDGAPGAAVYSFTDGDLIVTDQSNFDPFPQPDKMYNGANGSYPEPGEGWEEKDAPAYRNATFVAEDGGRENFADVKFPMVPYNGQVQQLLKAIVEDNRRFRSHVIILPPEAWLLEPLDIISWTSARNGYINKDFIITSISGRSNQNQILSIQEIDSSDYDWTPETDEKDYDIEYTGPVGVPTEVGIAGWDVDAAIAYDALGQERRPDISVSFDGDESDVDSLRVQVRLKSSGAIVYDKKDIDYGTPEAIIKTVNLNGVFLPLSIYEVRGKLIPFSGRKTDWTLWTEVTTLNIGLKSADISNAAIIAEKLADASVVASKIADNAVERTKFASGITPVEIGDTLPTTENFDGRQFYNTTDGVLYSYDNGVWNSAEFTIADGSITSAKIADAAITTSKLAQNAVTETKISDNSISTPKLQANSVTADQIAANSVIASKIILSDLSNIIKNPMFDDQSGDNWLFENDAEVRTLGSNDGPSKWAIRLPPNASFRPKASQIADPTNEQPSYVPVSAGETYYFSAWVLATSFPLGADDGNLYFQAVYHDAIGNAVGSQGTILITPSASGWHWHNGQFTVPNDPTIASARLHLIRIEATTGGNYYVTKIVMRKAANAELIVDGAITAGKIAANAITAGKIAAGAVNTQELAAGAVTTQILAAGAVTTNTLAVGTGRNMLSNASFTFGLDDWAKVSGSNVNFEIRTINQSWSGPITPTLVMWETAAPDAQTEARQWRPDNVGEDAWKRYSYPAKPGSWYEASAYISVHRCNAGVRLLFFDVNGNTIAAPYVATTPVGVQGDSANSDDWPRYGGKYQAPAGTVAVAYAVHKYARQAGETSSYCFIHKPQLCETHAQATELTPWSEGGIVLISNGAIVANSISSSKLQAGSVTADKISASTITADKIVANTIVSGNMANQSTTAFLYSLDGTDQTLNANGTSAIRHQLSANYLGYGLLAGNAAIGFDVNISNWDGNQSWYAWSFNVDAQLPGTSTWVVASSSNVVFVRVNQVHDLGPYQLNIPYSTGPGASQTGTWRFRLRVAFWRSSGDGATINFVITSSAHTLIYYIK